MRKAQDETSGSAIQPPAETYALILEVTRRERDLTLHRANGNQTRAGILVGSSGILGSSQLADGLQGLDWVALAAYLLAALMGVAVMMPRAMAAQPIERMYAMRAALTTVELRQLILEEEIRADNRAAGLTTRRSFVVAAGFALLVTGWVVSAVAVGIGGAEDILIVRLVE